MPFGMTTTDCLACGRVITLRNDHYRLPWLRWCEYPVIIEALAYVIPRFDAVSRIASPPQRSILLLYFHVVDNLPVVVDFEYYVLSILKRLWLVRVIRIIWIRVASAVAWVIFRPLANAVKVVTQNAVCSCAGLFFNFAFVPLICIPCADCMIICFGQFDVP